MSIADIAFISVYFVLCRGLVYPNKEYSTSIFGFKMNINISPIAAWLCTQDGRGRRGLSTVYVCTQCSHTTTIKPYLDTLFCQILTCP